MVIQSLSNIPEPVTSLNHCRAGIVIDSNILQFAQVDHKGAVLASDAICDVAVPTTSRDHLRTR